MNKPIVIALLVVAGIGTGCALLIAGTYIVLRIPLPFSVMLSCVTMMSAVMMMGIRVKKTRPAADGGVGFTHTVASEDGMSPSAAAQTQLLLLPAAGAEGHYERRREGPSISRTPVSIRVDAITLFELPLATQEQEAA